MDIKETKANEDETIIKREKSPTINKRKRKLEFPEEMVTPEQNPSMFKVVKMLLDSPEDSFGPLRSDPKIKKQLDFYTLEEFKEFAAAAFSMEKKIEDKQIEQKIQRKRGGLPSKVPTATGEILMGLVNGILKVIDDQKQLINDPDSIKNRFENCKEAAVEDRKSIAAKRTRDHAIAFVESLGKITDDDGEIISSADYKRNVGIHCIKLASDFYNEPQTIQKSLKKADELSKKRIKAKKITNKTVTEESSDDDVEIEGVEEEK